jgi:hypothetical protein
VPPYPKSCDCRALYEKDHELIINLKAVRRIGLEIPPAVLARAEQAALFYEFSLDRHVPADHLLRSIDRFVDLDGLRRELSPFYSTIGRPSIAPELMIRMLLVGYCFGIVEVDLSK